MRPTDIDEIESRIERLVEKRRSLSTKLETIDPLRSELPDFKEERAALRDKVETKTRTLEQLEEKIEALDEEELRKIKSRFEEKLGEAGDSRCDELRDELQRLKDKINEQGAEREEVQNKVEELRTKVERTERQAVEAFNEHMGMLLDLLGYQNLERVWLERTETEQRDGRKNVSKAVFKLHVVRSTESGATYEDMVGHLSESEREVTGLVFALAGYLVHDVHEVVPFMLLDLLEAIDSERIAKLIDYFGDYC